MKFLFPLVGISALLFQSLSIGVILAQTASTPSATLSETKSIVQTNNSGKDSGAGSYTQRDFHFAKSL